MNKKLDLLSILSELADIEPGVDATQRAVERAQATVVHVTTASVPTKTKIRMVPRTIAAAAAAVAGVFLLGHWLIPYVSFGGIAFAQVQQQVAKTKTVQYVETRTDRAQDNRLLEKSAKQVMILGTYMMREEVKTVPGKNSVGGAVPTQPASYVVIYDAKNGKLVTLVPEKKTFVKIQRILGIDDDGKVVESKVTPNPQADFYTRIRKFPADKAKKLPARNVAGKVATGFVFEEKIKSNHGTDTWTRTYWVDADTKLPLRIEVNFRTTNPIMGNTDWVQSDIVFDVPFDRSLFSTEVPAGYTDVTRENKAEGD